jgi:hypothetical protein
MRHTAACGFLQKHQEKMPPQYRLVLTRPMLSGANHGANYPRTNLTLAACSW